MLLDQVIMTDLTRVEEIRRQWNLNELRSVYVRQFCLILVFNIFIPHQILTCFFLPRSLCLITPSWGKRLLFNICHIYTYTSVYTGYDAGFVHVIVILPVRSKRQHLLCSALAVIFTSLSSIIFMNHSRMYKLWKSSKIFFTFHSVYE